MGAPREAFEELRAKYAQMLAMRVSHAAGADDAHEARTQMAELASRFPGALREIDDLELGEIRRRIERLDGVLHSGHEVEPWMGAVARFHRLARGALCAKRWLGKRKRIDPETVRDFELAVGSLLFPEEARAWANDLERIASPSRGRVTDVVFARLAEELGESEGSVRTMVFGVPRHRRARR